MQTGETDVLLIVHSHSRKQMNPLRNIISKSATSARITVFFKLIEKLEKTATLQKYCMYIVHVYRYNNYIDRNESKTLDIIGTLSYEFESTLHKSSL